MTKKRILIIDDEPGPRESLKFLFRNTYEVSCVDSVDKGVEEVKRNPPDCVISDVKMPGKTGIEALKEIHSIDPLISVIILTGFGTLENAQEAIRYGAIEYLKKPFLAKELQNVVAERVECSVIGHKQKETYEHLKTLTDQLQKKLDANEEFVMLGKESTGFVQDLKNPLTVIFGYVQILIQDIKKKEQKKEISIAYLEQIAKSASRCRDMLILWKERYKRVETSTQNFDIGKVIEEVAGNMRKLAKEKNAEILLKNCKKNCMVEGDRIQLFRAIQNVVRNGIESLSFIDGYLQIACRIDGSHVVVEVLDNGGGFPPEKIRDLQTKYYTTKEKSGKMGLGLFITKNILEAHNGSLIISNNGDNTGALITLAFPLIKPKNEN